MYKSEAKGALAGGNILWNQILLDTDTLCDANNDQPIMFQISMHAEAIPLVYMSMSLFQLQRQVPIIPFVLGILNHLPHRAAQAIYGKIHLL